LWIEAARQGVKLRLSLAGAAVPEIRLYVSRSAVNRSRASARTLPCVDAVVAFVGQLLAFVSYPVAFVSLAFADLRVNLTLVGPYFASADFRISVRHASTVVPAERQAEERT
jgi:hypothetical protein